MHISAILKEGELQENSVIKYFLTTAKDGKNYNVAFYSLEMILFWRRLLKVSDANSHL
jgi:hypothetical protein